MLLLLLIACGPSLGVGDDTALDDDPRFDDVLQAAQDNLTSIDATALSVAILEGEEITFAAAFGELDDESPVGTRTAFQIGSITKQLTAATVLQQVGAGTLTLDDPLSTAISGLSFAQIPDPADTITVRHLLTHQSGLYDWIPWALIGDDDDALDAFTLGDFAAYEYQMNPAGEFFNYSTPNYALAGLAVERADGRLWPDIVEREVLGRLRMTRSFARKASAVAAGDVVGGRGWYLQGTSWRFGDVPVSSVPDDAWLRPAGLLWSTPSDMVRWADFVLHGDATVLSDDLRAQITTPVAPMLYGPEGHDSHYSFGMNVDTGLWVDDDYHEVLVWHHSGATLSYTSLLVMLPEHDVAIAILASGYGVDLTPTLVAAIRAAVDLPAPVEPPEYAWSEARLDDHVGAYADVWGGAFTVTRDGNNLDVQAPALEALGYTVSPRLTAVSDTLFYVKVDDVPYDLTFIGTPGEPTSYVRNHLFVYQR